MNERPVPNIRREEGVGAVDFLVPTKVSGAALLSCYMGLVGFLLPLFGLLFAVPAVILGIVAILRRNKSVSYGSVTSIIRAVIGIVLGTLGILIWGSVWLLYLR